MSTRGSGGASSAQQQQSSAVQSFKPKSEWKHDEQASFLLVYLPGFAVDQLAITTDYSNASVRIEGKRRLSDNRMLPVDETFDIPRYLDLSKMDKQFGRGILLLKIPINSVLRSQEQSAVEDTPKLDPETPALADRASTDEKPDDNGRAAKPERTTDEAAAPAMDETGTGTAKTDEGKSVGNEKRESPETVNNNGDGEKDDGNKEQREESAMDSATKVEERANGKEDRAFIMNMGIAVFMLMGLGVSLLYTLGHQRIKFQ